MVPKKTYARYYTNYSDMPTESSINSSVTYSAKQCFGTIKEEAFLPNLIVVVSKLTTLLVASYFIHRFNKKWTIGKLTKNKVTQF